MGGILLCCADYRVGADGPYKIGLNEVGIGMPVPRFAVETCRARLSNHWFNRAIQLGYIHSPAEARDAGFLDEIVERRRRAPEGHRGRGRLRRVGAPDAVRDHPTQHPR